MADRRPGQFSRRNLLALSPVLLLGGFAVPAWQERWLERGAAFADRASDLLFRQGQLAQTFGEADLTPFERFPYNGYGVLEPELDFAAWQLTVSGAVAKPGTYSLDAIRALPKQTQNTRHVCVEGWEAMGRFGGARLADFLTMVGADPKASYVSVTCADGYYESLDIDTARHAQSLLCYEMYDRPLDRGHGAPLRLSLPTKLGYKHAKYLLTLDVGFVRPVQHGYWSDQGYSWYAGL